ncbi:MAG: serine/threonine-protein kinase, partial [Phycisphaerales bacterium]
MASRQELAERIFFELADMPPGAWPRELDRRCNGDAALKEEIRDLLDCHARAEGFLDNAELLAQSLGLGTIRPADEHELAPGTRVGEYTVQGVLGRGGMGTVYIAQQERPRRTVAVKIIRRSVSSQSLVRRFEHEADVLGRLHHPGIAQIYEAGAAVVEPGQPAQPYIAMELVNGPALNVYADEKDLDSRAKLELLAKVCDAVHHAHQRGVIHRDLKPGNILVDEVGQPKVLDFGVARAADADLRVTTLQTSVGQLIGTLPYMSPEQVLADPTEVDTRSDVYALGVVLYQLLTGRLPLDLKSRSIPEAARLIRDESPARLSSVNKVFRGDIETIVSKAMEKNKSRRYQSAADLAEDLRLHLSGRAINAKHDSAFYVLRKQLKRYRGFVAAAVVGLLSLTGFAIYAALQATRYESLAIKERLAREDAVVSQSKAETNRDLAKASAAEAAAKAKALDEQLFNSTIERARLEGLAGNLPRAEDLLWRSLLTNPKAQRARWALWELYSRDPVRWTVPGPNVHNECGDISEDGRLAVVGAEAGSIGIYNAATGAEVVSFKSHQYHVRRVSFVDRDRALITVASDGESARWDLSTKPPTEVWRLPCPDGKASYQAGDILRDGSRLWLITEAHKLWDIDGRSGAVRGSHVLAEGARYAGMASSQEAGLFALGDDQAGVS